MTQSQSIADSFPIVATTPADLNHERLIKAIGMPSSISGSSTFTSPLIQANSFFQIVAGVTLSENGSLVIQRYLDTAGTIPLDGGKSVSLTAATAAVLIVSDNYPCASWTLAVTNSSGDTATVSNFAALAAS